MAKAAKDKEEVKFRAVYFLETGDLHHPEKIKVVYVQDKELVAGKQVRGFPKREIERTGYFQGVWGENMADYKTEIGAWAMLKCSSMAEEREDQACQLRDSEQKWLQFLAEQE